MTQISIKNLTFAYDGDTENIFENVSFCFDTNWKIGLIGRNGRGKTTFLKLLQKQLDCVGEICGNVKFDYFPYNIKDKTQNTIDVVEQIYPEYELWQVIKNMQMLKLDENCLYKRFDTSLPRRRKQRGRRRVRVFALRARKGRDSRQRVRRTYPHRFRGVS